MKPELATEAGPMVAPDPATVPPPAAPIVPAVEVRNLHFHYDTSNGQIHDISFAVAEGECLGVVGSNGAGKSTLLLHLNGILPETFRGPPAVFIAGQGVGPKTLDTVRGQVGLLFQDPDDQLFCPTVFEDVAFGPKQMGIAKDRLAERVREALSQVGLNGFEDRLPHHLSGGEKRRACLAGLLACEPRVLVLDEPTSNLDPRGRRELIALLRKLPATKLIATHDLEMVVALCDRVIVLDGGRIVAQGPTGQVLADETLMLKHGLECPHSLKTNASR